MPRPVLSACAPSGTLVGDGLTRLLGGGLMHAEPDSAADLLRPGLDFVTRDHLGLRTHPAIRAAALAALGQHRGSFPDRPDPSDSPVRALERRIAAELRLTDATTFASGPDAIRHSLSAILGPGDDVLVDSGADPAMFETVLTTKARLHRFPSASVDGVERRLRRLARQPRHGRLVIAAPAVSALGARVTDLAELTLLARQHNALLVVDVSQDFGAMGQNGGGVMEIQNCLGRADLVHGSLAGSFGATGAFAAFRDPSLQHACPMAARLSPVSASAILAAAELAFSPEGRRRRRNLHGISLRLRNHLMADGARLLGAAAPFVPILLPAHTALPRTALLESAGPRVTLLMAPTVPLHAPRWQIELGALHGLADIDDLAELIRDVCRAFDRVPTRPPVLA